MSESSCKLKMVVIIATAVALGVGAVAACVVPYFYCKPPDSSDDDREASVINQNITSQSQTNIDGTSTMRIRFEDFKGFFKFEFSPKSPENPDTTFPENSAVQNTDLPQIQINEEPIFPAKKDKIHANISEVSNSENIQIIPQDSQEETEDSGEARSLEVQVEIVETGSNSELTESSLMLRVETNDIETFQTAESSNSTDEDSAKSTANISSENSNCKVQIENTKNRWNSVESTSKNEQGSKIDSISKSFDDLDSKKDSSKSNDGKWIPTESENSSRPSEVLTVVIVESQSEIESSETSESKNSSVTSEILADGIIDSSRTSEGLQTIPEISSQESFEESSKDFPKELIKIPKILPDKQLSISAFSSIKSQGKIQSSRITAETPSEISSGTPDSTERILSNQNNAKKRSLTNRFASAFSIDRLRGKFHRSKKDKTSEFLRENIRKEKLTDSFHNLSASGKLPAAQSTMLSDDQLLETVKRRRSMIFKKSASEINEDSPNSSIGSTFRNVKSKNLSFSEKMNRSCSGGHFFRELREHLRDWRSSRTSRSDSFKFRGGSSKSVATEDKENYESNSSLKMSNPNFAENRGCVSDPEENSGCLNTNSGKRRSRTLMNLFKSRSKNNDNLPSSSKKKCFDNIPSEFQRNSKEIKSNPNPKIDSTSESPANSSCYSEFDFAYLDDKKNREPSTEL